MPPTFPLGSVLRARYRISKLLHQSRLANVYMVEDTHLPGKIWAMKELRLVAVDPYEQKRVITRFHQDAAVLAALSHPNIAKVLDFFAEGQCLYIVREYVHGLDLRAYLAQRSLPLSDKDAILTGLQVIDALIYLNSKRFSAIFYREFHAGNIVICQDGSVKLIDLGLAQLFQAATDDEAAQGIGSVDYASPEQFSGTPKFDELSLVYAVGALLYHALTRVNPASSPFNLAPIYDYNPSVSRGLREVVYRATQNDHRQRFQNLVTLRRALQTSYRSSEHRGRTQKLRPASNWVVTSVLGFFFLALMGGAMLLLYNIFQR